MSSDEYDRQGTPKMLAKVLCSSLGLSEEELGRKVCHMIYDGVYASPEERLNKSGLSLRQHFEEFLKLPPGSITGQHDLSHNLQLCYHQILNRHEAARELNEIIKEMYSVMKNLCSGKERTVFFEFVDKEDLEALKMQKYNETRFARSDLNKTVSYLRNIPAMYRFEG